MLVPELLLQTLEDLLEDNIRKFKWYLMLNVLESCKPIPQSRLENATRTDIVSRMIESYGEASAVNITVEILKRMDINAAAEKLKNTYAATKGNTGATSSSSSASAPGAAPVTISAHQGGVVIAPMIYGGTSGSFNINSK